MTWQRLRDETALVHLQLAPADTDAVVNVLGAGFPLRAMPFILQHRAVLLGDRIDDASRAGDKAEARRLLDEWVTFLARFWQNEVTAQVNFDDNYGYVRQRMVLLDVGDFRYGREAVMHDVERDVIRSRSAFGHLHATHPDVADHLSD